MRKQDNTRQSQEGLSKCGVVTGYPMEVSWTTCAHIPSLAQASLESSILERVQNWTNILRHEKSGTDILKQT